MPAIVGALGVHDVGGKVEEYGPVFPGFGPADEEAQPCTIDSPVKMWEKQIHSLLGLLCRKGKMTVDEMRRGVEGLPVECYKNWSYYEKWAAAILQVAIERGTVSKADVDKHLYGIEEGEAADIPTTFKVGDYVRVKREDGLAYVWPRPHLRTPGYIFDMVGVVESVVGVFHNPEFLAYHRPAPKLTNYIVVFKQGHVWGAGFQGSNSDEVGAEIYQSWLVPATKEEYEAQHREYLERRHGGDHDHSHSYDHDHGEDHDHDHDHDHGHKHEERVAVEQKAVENEGKQRPGERLAAALVAMVLANGTITRAELQAAMEGFDLMGSRAEGARLVARAWVDSEFKARLLADGNEAAKELGIMASNAHTYTRLMVIEATPTVHPVIVCTLCSCYPLSILGPSPAWYKSRSYRARIVREPREVLKEWGTIVPEGVKVRVHDSTADCRYMVLPLRPAGTEGWDEEKLQSIVTRDSMVGVTVLHPVKAQ